MFNFVAREGRWIKLLKKLILIFQLLLVVAILHPFLKIQNFSRPLANGHTRLPPEDKIDKCACAKSSFEASYSRIYVKCMQVALLYKGHRSIADWSTISQHMNCFL